MILKGKHYIHLLINNSILLFVFYIISLFDVGIDLLYPITFVSLIFSVYFVAMVYAHYPSERLNPLLLLSLIYATPFSLTVVLAGFNKIVSWEDLMNYYGHFDIYNLTNTLILAYTFSVLATLFAYIIFLSQAWQKAKSLLHNSLTHQRSIIILFATVIALTELLLIVSGQVTLQGESLLDKEKGNLTVNPIFAVINPIACISVFITAYLYGSDKQKRWLLLLLAQFIWFFLLGRRNMMYFTILLFLGLFYGKNLKLFILNFNRLVNLGLIFLFLFFIKTAASFYHDLRLVGGVAILQNVSVESVESVAQEYLSSNRKKIAFKSAYNLEVRPFSIIAGVARYDNIIINDNFNYGYGREMYNSLLITTPSSYFVDKSSTPTMEELASMLTHGSIQDKEDMGDSILMESLMDFGYFGVFIYCIIIFLIIYAFIYMYSRFNNPFLMLCLLVTLFFSILTMAEGGIAVLFLTLRVNLFILLLILCLYALYAGLTTPKPEEKLNSIKL